MEKEAWLGKVECAGETPIIKKKIRFNLYGKVIWYFANTFNYEDMPYVNQLPLEEKVKKGVETVKKYCMFGNIIQ